MAKITAKALEYLQAAQVAEDRYALPIDGAYYVFSQGQIESVYHGDGEGGFRTAREVALEGSATKMPEKWTPERPFALRNAAGEIAALYPTRSSALDGMISGDHVLTGDLETGKWVPARNLERDAAARDRLEVGGTNDDGIAKASALPQQFIDRAQIPGGNAVNRAVMEAADEMEADATAVARHVHRAIEPLTPTWDPDQRWAQAYELAQAYDGRDSKQLMEGKLLDKVWGKNGELSGLPQHDRLSIARGATEYLAGETLRGTRVLTDAQAKSVASEWFAPEAEGGRFVADGTIDADVRYHAREALMWVGRSDSSDFAHGDQERERGLRELRGLNAYLNEQHDRGPVNGWSELHAAVADERAAFIAGQYQHTNAALDLFGKTGAITETLGNALEVMQTAARENPDRFTDINRAELADLAHYVATTGPRGPVNGWPQDLEHELTSAIEPKAYVPVAVVHQPGRSEEFSGEYLGRDADRVFQMNDAGTLLAHDGAYFERANLPDVGARMHVAYHPTQERADVRELPAREDAGREQSLSLVE